MLAPAAISRKAALLTPNHPGERVSVVLFDVLRCSSTIAALFAAGAHSVTVSLKGTALGTAREEAVRVANVFSVPLLTAGEVGGKPISGGVVGNSPRQAASAFVKGCHIWFSSTNLGLAFTQITSLAHEFDSGAIEVLLGTAANVEALALRLRRNPPERIFLILGGFYENPSFEDLHAAGRMIQLLELGWDELDDEARVMLACAIAVSPATLRSILHTGWIGRCLKMFHAAADIDAVCDGSGMPPLLYERMWELIPEVHFCDGVPVLFPGCFGDATLPVASPEPPNYNSQPIERTKTDESPDCKVNAPVV
jgi:phosphosulfolactate phosphohydrolase-like enzyme